jgi:hypothetical protein
MDEDLAWPELSSLKNARERHRLPGHYPKTVRQIRVLCVPIGDILKALELKHIDFWSVDLEGFDLEVLQTFPWHEIDVEGRNALTLPKIGTILYIP